MRALLAAAFAAFSLGAVALAQAVSVPYDNVVVNGTALSQSEQYVSRDNAAIHGYDAVAYHTEGAPTPGDPAIGLEYNGAVWLFASEENRALFEENPARYAPAFDGHCAFAAASGGKAGGHPEYWRIEDGVLYLNLNENAQSRFLADLDGNIESAVRNWNEGSGGLFGGGPLFERGASRALRNVDGEVTPNL